MKWQTINFDWNQVRAFLATAEEGSLSAAARALGSTQPTLGRQVSALEETLGVTLFERTSRTLMLTQAGQELLQHVRDMGEAAQRVSLVAAGQSQDVTGTVTVTASDMMATYYLPRMLADLRARAPGLMVHVLASNQLQDLTRREADIAIRHVRPDQPDLIAKMIGMRTARLYAARSYLDRRGRLKRVEDIARHDFVVTTFQQLDLEQMAADLTVRGFPMSADQIVGASDLGTSMLNMVRAGMGVSILPDEVGAKLPELEVALPDGPVIEFPIWLTTHRELHTSRRLRIVFDALDAALRDLERWIEV
ncbi:LysR family transcriptional regulator [Shimia ponticola]|uniref:LysR family transcriptional regulator n=1 Tax=Shimia ponticola TaxID=2582893 RepID=UPI0011BDA49C|nr:LysR family transcriptional regulator [Shimia ponticola]